MLRQIILLFISLVVFGCGQKRASWKYLLINDTKYQIEGEGTVAGSDTVRTNLKVSAPYDCGVRFTHARLHDDTLKIVLHETAEKCSNEFVITVVKGIYKIDHQLSLLSDSTETETDRIVVEEASKVMLSTADFRKGSELRGFVSFKGWREKNPGGMPVSVKGNFAVLVE